ncbi:MAG TPA: apolipoprotein N-acyltransferase [Blastocatellia bacterium]|nr:apolipoprotein N-acyltransferase [Blastocatellia bacterium]
MQDVVSGRPLSNAQRLADTLARLHEKAPALVDFGAATVSAVLLILSFPDFNLWPLAWCALVPLLLVVAMNRGRSRPFFLGWVFGTVFFYGSCYWLTYSMIHTGGISPLIAYPLLLPGAVLLGIFPGLFGLFMARAIRKWGTTAVFLAPVVWSGLEWSRLEVTGQLWNAIGYSQAFHHSLIGPARWGGVYAVGAVIIFVNSAIAFTLLRRTKRALWRSAVAVLLMAVATLVVNISMSLSAGEFITEKKTEAVVIAIQPNVPMDLVKSNDDMELLTTRHFEMSEAALKQVQNSTEPRLLIWPESPMNFAYGGDERLRAALASFAQRHHVSILLNSQEIAPNDGIYNSAVLINEQGKLVAQYDKIRLLPFGEYVPLPDWVPGSGLIRAIVGDFTAGTNYRLMPVGNLRAGVFICIESAYPAIARRFTNEGADVLINISNDGYLGPTAVMRQHLANAVFRAVENGRPLLSVTNTGITAFVGPNGETKDATSGFKPEVRIWSVSPPPGERTFYTKYGDVFVISCAIFSLLILVFTFVGSARKAGHD